MNIGSNNKKSAVDDDNEATNEDNKQRQRKTDNNSEKKMMTTEITLDKINRLHYGLTVAVYCPCQYWVDCSCSCFGLSSSLSFYLSRAAVLPLRLLFTVTIAEKSFKIEGI